MLFSFVYLAFFVLFGLVIGSFLNAAEYRLFQGESLLKNKNKTLAKSHCPHCQTVLKPQELVPVFSFLFLKGRCRTCHQQISWQYPAVELGSAVLFLWSALVFVQVDQAIFVAIISAFLLFIFLYDLKHQLVLDVVTVPAIILAGLGSIFVFQLSFLNLILGALLGGGFFLAQYLISRGRWIGGGDIRLGILMGVLLGWERTLLALMLAYILGALIALILLIQKKAHANSRLAFGTFLTLSTFFSLLYGTQLIDWYLKFLL
ncbi:MAG: hypothetical protein A2233_02090 [Candidatus Kerfeldbacteria bacterium RIFOXYA2_FULL_38_24]|uniref:Prepilin peptidase n=1 Tax=Candidatus Kerfeldbacteria bacterium RIFOXYB2_FULL_38_14 TaxID=1798547 RepID=A0A1G2BF89_9BACT|nr:MAG: hypothetical protein A2319_04690 [Candidatus Kerfeldbacteria bacterium RIFOXYB2_FULL_38_14]OGY87905.1 MAG: hypothetical protein A2233_02090 [Candidatus Kerfeldbacteria bacterium RIFOXYA2_FULL_38_24]OGY88680.1 MAG: hypothetical protein A2458_03515 [Candidatus Kerfeldbacteria bacterium RIFOXYC2_FULL_38_9]